ncbi:uncharacterized protein PRCAT00001854001 [Priceomyces carsonii]|uniref:uncharacterized protein n=1 Tax=Priceomyces carsonii TaxID=28549 RepID=UPI002EDAF7F3|nr:unnamed protein product [Priceomyces carsonii]
MRTAKEQLSSCRLLDAYGDTGSVIANEIRDPGLRMVNLLQYKERFEAEHSNTSVNNQKRKSAHLNQNYGLRDLETAYGPLQWGLSVSNFVNSPNRNMITSGPRRTSSFKAKRIISSMVEVGQSDAFKDPLNLLSERLWGKVSQGRSAGDTAEKIHSVPPNHQEIDLLDTGEIDLDGYVSNVDHESDVLDDSQSEPEILINSDLVPSSRSHLNDETKSSDIKSDSIQFERLIQGNRITCVRSENVTYNENDRILPVDEKKYRFPLLDPNSRFEHNGHPNKSIGNNPILPPAPHLQDKCPKDGNSKENDYWAEEKSTEYIKKDMNRYSDMNDLREDNKRKRKASLGEICSKTNRNKLPLRVGLSRRNKVEPLHDYLKK